MPPRSSVLTAVGLVAAVLTAAGLTACGSSAPVAAPSRSTSAPPASTSIVSTSVTPTTSTRAVSKTTPKTTARRTHPTPSPSSSPAKKHTERLPLDLGTGDATQVVTVVSSGRGDTTGTLQRWTRDGSHWRKVGSGVHAYLGSAGIGKARESSRKTPAGSFTLTQAFGRESDPGTRLPYTRTTPDDYWISSPGPKYNTRQRCGDCGYKNGVNERLYYVTPQYEHAVVIDYNTRNAPGGVKPGRGSAFFLHVSAGEPTAGCVAIPKDDLDTVMRWLRPADHPRILIGTD